MSTFERDEGSAPRGLLRRERPSIVVLPPLDGAGTGPRGGSPFLRWLLRGVDVIALVLAWGIAELLAPAAHPATSSATSELLFGLVPFVLVGYALIANQRLYLARVAALRTVEQAGLARAAVLLAVAAAALDQLRVQGASVGRTLLLGALTFVALAAARGTYQAWLKSQRRAGSFMRPVVIVGIDGQTAELVQVMSDHPELGFEATGVIGSRVDAEHADLGHLWIGDLEALEGVLEEGEVTGAILSATAIDPGQLNAITRLLLEHRCHVHLGAGISGIDQRRIRPTHLGYEPLLYLEPLELTHGQLVAKRALDLVVAGVVGLLVLPVLLAAAIAIKLDDRGPVLFRQRRVGRDGEPFTILKLRTMVVGAEEHLDELLPYNERNGPLFKMAHDPRVTGVGKVLRTLNIDELPQLWNVLRGDMSLVGPRPALPSEAVFFGERLRARTRVLPGVTGLWQVEANASASMHTYERLDLYYVENWSLGLDAMVIVATIEEELAKLLRHLRGRLAAGGRLRAAMSVGVAVSLAVGLGFGLLSACSGDDEPAAATEAPGEGATGGDEGLEPAPGQSDTADVADPVGLRDATDFGDGVGVRLSAIEAVTVTGSLPGERSGPGVAITVEITNDSASAVDLTNVIVDLADAAGASAAPIRSPDDPPLDGELAPGESAAARYLFSLPLEDRADAAVRVSYSTSAPTVIFSGSLPDA